MESCFVIYVNDDSWQNKLSDSMPPAGTGISLLGTRVLLVACRSLRR
jgi:hypothetical protein